MKTTHKQEPRHTLSPPVIPGWNELVVPIFHCAVRGGVLCFLTLGEGMIATPDRAQGTEVRTVSEETKTGAGEIATRMQASEKKRLHVKNKSASHQSLL